MLFILDRDGVINADPVGYINDPKQWHALAGSIEAIAYLHQAGHKVAVCSNQSGVGRGLITAEQLAQVHQKMTRQITEAGGALCGIYFCPHRPDEACECRKPNPFLYERIIATHAIGGEVVWAIGDSVRDIAAGIATNCSTALVLTGNGQQQQDELPAHFNTKIYANLNAAVKDILAGN
jgi:D-glycero-D-manno-heptose 1,7-bisphosphate phosphatase